MNVNSKAFKKLTKFCSLGASYGVVMSKLDWMKLTCITLSLVCRISSHNMDI